MGITHRTLEKTNVIGTLIASSIQKPSRTTFIACSWFCFGLSVLDEAGHHRQRQLLQVIEIAHSYCPFSQSA